MKKRRLAAAVPQREPDPGPNPDPESEMEAGLEAEDEPDWLEAAACVCSLSDAQRSRVAQDALLAAGVPAHISIGDVDGGKSEYQVMVPPGLHLKAKSVLDVQIFNERDEEGIRVQLEGLSDDEFNALTLDDLCGGLRDMLERVTRVYEDEVARRST